MNFAYALYLYIRDDKGWDGGRLTDGEVKTIVRKWFVMSVLTGRYTGSFETAFEADIRRVSEIGAAAALDNIERSTLSDNFWTVSLPMSMESSSVRSPGFLAFLAAQVHGNARGFLSKNITIANMLAESGDIHHLVPKNYLVKHGYTDRNDYNQVANYALTETPINISIKDRAPSAYMALIDAQAIDGTLRLGEITDSGELNASLSANAVPASIRETTADTYGEFLEARRVLMADYIRRYCTRL